MAVDYSAVADQILIIREVIDRMDTLITVGARGVHAAPYMTNIPFTTAELTDLEGKYLTIKNELSVEVCKL